MRPIENQTGGSDADEPSLRAQRQPRQARTCRASQRRGPERGSATRSSLAGTNGWESFRTPCSRMLISCTAALALLSGCAVGPNYKPPQTSVGVSFANTPTNVVSADEAALATWWKGFNDGKLDG